MLGAQHGNRKDSKREEGEGAEAEERRKANQATIKRDTNRDIAIIVLTPLLDSTSRTFTLRFTSLGLDLREVIYELWAGKIRVPSMM